MRQTGDTAQFEAMSGPDCQFCASSVENATEIHAAGGWVEGGTLDVDLGEATAEYPTSEEPSYLVRFNATELPSIQHNSDGTTVERDGASFASVVAIRFVDGRFIVFGVNAE